METSRLSEILEITPQVVDFGLKQNQKERENIIKSLSNEDQEKLLDLLLNTLLYLGQDMIDIILNDLKRLNTVQLLIYLMPTDEIDISDGDCEFRGYSPDWRLQIFRNELGTFCDFNGWPGDNEDGCGIFYPADGSQKQIIFINGDSDLIANLEKHQSVVDRYMEKRQQFYDQLTYNEEIGSA